MNIEFKILRPALRMFGLPQFATPGAAGLDLCACLDAPHVLKPGGTVFIPTGFAMHMKNKGIAALVLSRSGLGTKKGLVVKQGVGLIDSDYQGEVIVALHNIGSEEQTIQPGDRIAQLMVMPVLQPSFTEVAEFNQISERGSGGFGSTGERFQQNTENKGLVV